MDKNQILEKLAAVVVDGTEEEAKALAQAAVEAGIDPLAAIEQMTTGGSRKTQPIHSQASK